MKARRFKFFSFPIILSLLLTAIIGCNSSGNKKAENNGAPIQKQLEQKSLTFFLIDATHTGEGIKPDQQLVLDEIAKESKLNIKLKFITEPAETYYTNLGKNLASNSIDAYFSYAFATEENLQNGDFKDITQMLPEFAPDLYAKYTKEDLRFGMFNGKLIALPPLYPAALSAYAIVREDLKVKYGIKDIKNLEDYGLYLKTIKENEAEIIPGINTISIATLIQIISDYSMLYPPDFLFCYNLNDPKKILLAERTVEFRNIVDTLAKWKKSGYTVFQNKGLSLVETALGGITEGKVSSFLITPELGGMTINSLVPQIENQLKYVNGNAKIKAYRLYPEKKVVRLDPIKYSGGLAFNGKSSNIERILMFLNWVQSSQENYNLLMYGIKDKHYTLKNGQLDTPDAIKNETNPYIGWAGNYLFRNLEYELVPVGYPADSNKDYMDYIKSNLVYYAPLSGFYPDFSSNEQKFIDRYQKFAKLFEYPLNYDSGTGTYDYSTNVESKLKEVEDTEGDFLLKDIQNQLDEWMAQNSK